MFVVHFLELCVVLFEEMCLECAAPVLLVIPL